MADPVTNLNPQEVNAIEHAESSDNLGTTDPNHEHPIGQESGVTVVTERRVDIGPDGKRRRLVRQRIVREPDEPSEP
jgi:hypothetical protein